MSDDNSGEITIESTDGYFITITSAAGANSGGWTITSGGGGWGTITGGGGTGGTCSTGGTISWVPGVTGISNIPHGQLPLPLPDIDLAVPVDKKKKNSDGCSCKKCKEYFPYAEPNQTDGTLICYGCRMRW